MTPEEIAQRNALIREMRQNGASQDQIAQRFGITQQRVSQKLVAMDESRRITGRPCPKCSASSKTIKTWPPTEEFTKRKHRCRDCGFEWTSRQVDE